jgi:predicted alpha/beta-hydrolase family hydrolase
MKPYIEALRRRGIDASAVELPRHGRTVVKAEKAVPAFLEQVPSGSIAGGHSYGGRVASLASLERTYKGLILLSYPLHRPGHPEELRIDHWPLLRCPVLLLSGESDPFARLDLLREAVRGLPQGELVTYPGVRHGLIPVVELAMARAADFVQRVSTAG